MEVVVFWPVWSILTLPPRVRVTPAGGDVLGRDAVDDVLGAVVRQHAGDRRGQVNVVGGLAHLAGPFQALALRSFILAAAMTARLPSAASVLPMLATTAAIWAPVW